MSLTHSLAHTSSFSFSFSLISQTFHNEMFAYFEDHNNSSQCMKEFWSRQVFFSPILSAFRHFIYICSCCYSCCPLWWVLQVWNEVLKNEKFTFRNFLKKRLNPVIRGPFWPEGERTFPWNVTKLWMDLGWIGFQRSNKSLSEISNYCIL